MAKWLIINGSPRINGKSARVVRMLIAQLEATQPEVELGLFEVATSRIEGCNGCEFCETAGTCIYDDDMAGLIEQLDSAQRVLLVAPIYFAGAPSQAKAMLDRMQPYFWPYLERKRTGQPLPAKRPLNLFVVGDGGDPHGYEPLVASVRSSMALAGFAIEEVIPLVGLKTIRREDLGKWGA